jgi:hypothetical protein
LLCTELKKDDPNDFTNCGLGFSVTVTRFDPDLEDGVRQANRRGAPKGIFEQSSVDFLLTQIVPTERRIFILYDLPYCGHRGDFAGCTIALGPNTILALDGINQMLYLDRHAITLAHELGHQVDLYDRLDPGLLMYYSPQTGKKLEHAEAEYFVRLREY